MKLTWTSRVLERGEDFLDVRGDWISRREVGSEPFGRRVAEQRYLILMIRHVDVIDLCKIVILGRHPEERDAGDLPPRFHLAGQGHGREGLVQSVERASEESHLLTGHDHHCLRVAEAGDALKEFLARSPSPVLICEDSDQVLPGIDPSGKALQEFLLRLLRIPSIKIPKARRPLEIIPENGVDPWQ